MKNIRVASVLLGLGLLAACGDTIDNTTIVGVTTTAAVVAAGPTTTAATSASTAAATSSSAPATTAPATTAAVSTSGATTAAPPTSAARTGNSLSQAPADYIVDACAKGDSAACGELDARVAAYGEPDYDSSVGPPSQEYLCLFYARWAQNTDPTFGLTYLQKLFAVTGPAPGGVTDGIARLLQDPTDSTAFRSLTGYMGGICGD